MQYLTQARFEKNADNGLKLHMSLCSAAEAVQGICAAGGTVRLFVVKEVEFELVQHPTLVIEDKADA